jgi:membrane dipeptidase
MASLAGIECVALGSDFDGIPSSPVDLRNAAHVPRILRELDRRGFRPDEIAKIAGLNFLRVFRQVCG